MTFPESGNVSYELLSPNLDGSLELALINLLPQTASSMEPVAHKGEEIAFIIKGHVKLYLNDEVLLLNPGESGKIHHHLLVFFHYFFLNYTPSCSPYNIPT